jgi:hypothetical protein
MDDKELFEAAVSDTPVETATETPEVQTDQPRDDKGRFAAKAEDAEQEVEQVAQTEQKPVEQKPDEAHVPSWRLREEREAREAAERRAQEERAYWQRQLQEVQARLPKEAPARPDMFENPDGFVEHGVRQAVDPVKSELQATREFYSRKDAIREHGQEAVKAAYDALAQGLNNRDPEAVATYQRAMSSMDPYGDIVTWHQQRAVYSQIGKDPNAWFEKTLADKLSDPTFAGSILQKIQQTSNPQRTNIVQLPPSLSRVPAAAPRVDDEGDLSDASLFKYATR